jgi:hypothetical protein
MAAATTISSSRKKRYVHIRDLAFHPSTLKCSIGDLVVFIHDGAVEEFHSLCIPEVASSPALKKGQRWEFEIITDDVPQDSRMFVIDSLYSFMRLQIRVKSANASSSSPTSQQLKANATEKYADSFVYAAANVMLFMLLESIFTFSFFFDKLYSNYYAILK